MADQEARLRITAVDATRQAFASVGRNLNNLERTASGIRRSFAALGAGVGVGAIVSIFTEATRRAGEAERAINNLNATLRATGFSAGQTGTDVRALATQLSRASVFDDDDILAALNALLRFRDVQGEVFRDAAKLLPDVAVALGTDLVQAAQALGRALSGEGKEGMRAFLAAGVKLSGSQIELAEKIQETGNIAGAQRIKLDELAKSIGGIASAENQGVYGATRAVSKAWDDLLKTIGRSAVSSGFVVDSLIAITRALEGLEKVSKRVGDLGSLTLDPGQAMREFLRSDGGGVRGATHADVRRVDRGFENELRAAQQGQAARRAEQINEAEAERRRNLKKKKGAGDDPAAELLEQLRREKVGLRELSRETEILAQLETARYAKVGAAQRGLIVERAREVDAIKDASRILDEQAVAEREATDLAVQQAREVTALVKEENEQYAARAEAIRRSIDPVRELKQEIEAAREAFERGFIDLDELQAFEQKVGRDMADALDETTEATKRAQASFDEFKSTTASALEEAIVNFESLRDVINGLAQDLLRMAVRRGIVNPLFDALFGGGPGVAGGSGGAFGDILGKIFKGFAGGGSFTVGGAGGSDSQLVAFRATPGERVSVSQPGGGAANITMNVYAQDATSFRKSQRQILTDLRLGLARSQG